MAKLLILLLFVLATTLQLNAATKDKSDMTNVDDFSRCTKIKIKKLHVDDEVCVKIAFFASKIGIEISITWDGKTIFKTEVSVQNPPPICFKIPLVKEFKACLKLTDVSFKPHHHGACLSIEIKALVIHKTFKLGCIYKEIEEANSKSPLEILQAVRALVNENAEKTGLEKADWFRDSDESGNEEKTKNFLGFFAPRDVEKQADADGKTSNTCTCPQPRQCICCRKVVLSPRYQTKVCGKVDASQKGKGLWVSLAVDEVKHFRVYTPVSRRFKSACSKVELHNTEAAICLQLKKVVQTVNGIDLCLSAAIHDMSSKDLVSLGCMTIKIEEDEEKQSEDLVKFKPHFRLFL
ncbi:uncharacterized protein LOC116302155 [Actinia tenebrosa]|uniref:Uncharacterized protein LOC116302155 n=1 Tax=Actinia tenebrosa TaxID=6105 RepID=A0A6P8IJZ3_ACTTE|nr:uncharacterized protein LOC116302155 [Actinia tenebrosa]